MNRLKKWWPLGLIFLIFGVIFRQILFQDKVAVPADTLVGAYYPWLHYKWGFVTGVPVKNALLSDSFSHFFLFKHLAVDLLKVGQWPLWNRFSLAGLPFLAAYHTSTLFPGNLLLFLPKFTGWNLYIVSSTVFAALTMYLFLGRLVQNKLARVLGSVVFATAGPMTTWLEFGTGVWAAAALPLLLYSLDQAIVSKRKLFWPLFSFSFALMFLAGHVQIDTYAVFLTVGYVLFLSRLQKERLWQNLFFLFLFGSLGVLLCAFQVLPTYDLYKISIRGEENYASSFHYGLVHWTQLIRLWVADFYGNPSTSNQWGSFIYHEYSSFIGVLATPLVLLTLLVRQKPKTTSFFVFCLIASLFLVIQSPISEKIFSLPLPLLTYSSASRLFFITALAAGVLAAVGAQTLSQNFQYRKKFGLVCLILILINITAFIFVPRVYLGISVRNSLLPILILSLVPIALLLTKAPLLSLLILLGVSAFDNGRYLQKYNPFVSSNLVFPPTPTIEFLQKQQGIFRIARVKSNLFPPNSWVYYGLESVEGYEPLRPLPYSRLFHLLENRNYTNSSSRYSELEDLNPKFLDALNVKYILAVAGDQATAPLINKLKRNNYQVVFSDKHTDIYQSPSWQNRAYFVKSVISVDTQTQMAQVLEKPDFDPSSQAVIYDSQITISPSVTSSVQIDQYTNDKLQLTGAVSADSFLMISNNYDPGWKAFLNDKSVKLYQTDGSLQGIRVPAGSFRLSLEYRPRPFYDGLKLSLISLITLVSLSVIIKLRLSYGTNERTIVDTF